MESEIRNAVMVGVVLIALSVVILIAFTVFGVARNTASDGSQNIQTMVSNFSDIDFKGYEDTDVLGSDVLNAISTYKNKDLAILVHTSKMDLANALASRTQDRYILYFNDMPLINYGAILSTNSSSYDIIDTNKVPKNTRLAMGSHKKDNIVENSSGQGLMTDGIFCRDNNGNVIKDLELGPVKTSGMTEYINPSTHFNSRLLRNYNDEIIGICFIELN